MSLWISPHPWSCPTAPDSAAASRRNCSDLHRLPDEAIERLASCVVDHEHRLPALAQQFQWPQCPGSCPGSARSSYSCVRRLSALERRMLSAGRDGYERVRLAAQRHPAVVCRTHGRRLATAPPRSRLPNQPRTRRMPSSVRPFLRLEEVEVRRRMSSVSGTASKRQREAEDSGRQTPAQQRDYGLQRCGQHASQSLG